jgi:ERCC4-type nuclease
MACPKNFSKEFNTSTVAPYRDAEYAIVVDQREKDETKNLMTFHCSATVETLVAGDIAVYRRHNGVEQLVLLFERKTPLDLAASMRDGRCESQRVKLLTVRHETKCSLIYLIEGQFKTDSAKVGSHTHMTFGNLRTHLYHMTDRDVIPVEFTASLNETIMHIIARTKAYSTNTYIALPNTENEIRGAENEIRDAENEIRGADTYVGGIAPPVLDKSHVVKKIICAFNGVGKKMVEILYKQVCVGDLLMYTVEEIAALKKTETTFIGLTLARKIKNTPVATILAKIPGWSLELATHVLSTRTFASLLNVDCIDIRDINGRRITEKIKKLHSYIRY